MTARKALSSPPRSANLDTRQLQWTCWTNTTLCISTPASTTIRSRPSSTTLLVASLVKLERRILLNSKPMLSTHATGNRVTGTPTQCANWSVHRATTTYVALAMPYVTHVTTYFTPSYVDLMTSWVLLSPTLLRLSLDGHKRLSPFPTSLRFRPSD